MSEPPFACANAGIGVPARPSRITRSSSSSGTIADEERIVERRSGAQFAGGSVTAGTVGCEKLVEINDLVRRHGSVGRIGLTGRIAARDAGQNRGNAAKSRQTRIEMLHGL